MFVNESATDELEDLMEFQVLFGDKLNTANCEVATEQPPLVSDSINNKFI